MFDIAALAPALTFIGGVLNANDQQYLAKQAHENSAANYDSALGLIDQLIGNVGSGLGQQQQVLEDRQSFISDGFRAALGQLDTVGQTARTRTLQREGQTIADLNQGLASRGLYNTTVGPAATVGVRANTDRELAGIDESMAALRSGLVAQSTQAGSQALKDLADFYGFSTTAQSGAEQLRINTVLNHPGPYVEPPDSGIEKAAKKVERFVKDTWETFLDPFDIF